MNLTTKNKWIILIFSALAGFVNGFLGGGGGVIIVALLLAVLKLHQKHAQATALLVVLPLTVVSAIVYLIKGNVAKIVFAVVLIAGGIKMFF